MKYENVVVMGDFNIDINKRGARLDNLDKFCNLFNLTNLIKSETLITLNHKSSIDLILTNRPSSFHSTCTTETGLSDFHLLILTFFKSHYIRLRPKIIEYRNYKHFDQSSFLGDLRNVNFSASKNDAN